MFLLVLICQLKCQIEVLKVPTQRINTAGTQGSAKRRIFAAPDEAPAAAAPRIKAEAPAAADLPETPAQADRNQHRKLHAAAPCTAAASRQKGAKEGITAAPVDPAAAAAARVKPELREATPPLDAPAQADKGKQRALTPQIHLDSEEAGPSAPPDQDVHAGPSGPPWAAGESTRACGQVTRIKREDVIDLSAESPRAFSSTQLPAELGAGLQSLHAAPDQGGAGGSCRAFTWGSCTFKTFFGLCWVICSLQPAPGITACERYV